MKRIIFAALLSLFSIDRANAILMGRLDIFIPASAVAAASVPAGANALASASSVPPASAVSTSGASTQAAGVAKSVSVSTINGQNGESVSVNIFQGYLLFNANADKCKGVIFGTSPDQATAQDCLDNSDTVPFYVIGHITQSTATVVALNNDILDNQQGGILNIKLTPLIYPLSRDDKKSRRSDPYGFTAFFDLGEKLIQSPTKNTTTNSSYNFINSTYCGIGVNYETMAIGSLGSSSSGQQQHSTVGAISLGVGYYRNWLSGPDSSLYTSPIANAFYSGVISAEIQLPGALSLSVYHVAPDSGAKTPYGNMTILSFNFSTAK
jgi:hypothetical protein